MIVCVFRDELVHPDERPPHPVPSVEDWYPGAEYVSARPQCGIHDTAPRHSCTGSRIASHREITRPL